MKRGVELVGYAGVALLGVAGALRLLVIDSGSMALVLGAAGVVLFLVYFFRAGAEIQQFLGRRSTREGGNALAVVLLVLGSLFLVNLLGREFRLHRDLTADRLYSLAPETVRALEAAPAPPEIWVFQPEGSALQNAVRELAEAARLAVPRVEVHIVDPDRDPARAVAFGLNDYGTVVRVGDKKVIFTGWHEEDFVSALTRASSSKVTSIGFLNGHGEAYPAEEGPAGLEDAGRLLDRRGYVVRGVNLTRHPYALIDSLDVLAIVAPREELTRAEEDSVLEFLQRGGSLLLLLDPSYPVGLDGILSTVGLRFDPRFLSDPDQRDPQVLVPVDFSNHPVVRDLRNRRMSPVLRGVGEVSRETRSGIRTATLMWSGPRAVVAGEEDSVPRRRALAVAAERPGDPRMRMVVVGDRDFALNALFGTLGSGDLFLGAIQWLIQREDLVSIRPRLRTSRPVSVSRQQGRALLVLLVGLVPLAVLGVGTLVWWRRRG